MLVRLAFSAAIQVQTEVLLIDEVLAVGDANFQQKCFDQFQRLKQEGRTILFVTHDMGAVERFCDRAMLLDHGRMVQVGKPAEVARSYNRLNFSQPAPPASDAGREHAGGKVAAIVDGWFEDASGQRTAECAYGDQCRVCIEVEFHQPAQDPIFGVALINESGIAVQATSTDQRHGSTDRFADDTGTGHFAAGSKAVFRLRFENWLAPGRYSLTASVARRGFGEDVLDLRDSLAAIVVHTGPRTTGLVQFPHTMEIDQL
jgi:ABC-type multidrug transport system ATPase subunit